MTATDETSIIPEPVATAGGALREGAEGFGAWARERVGDVTDWWSDYSQDMTAWQAGGSVAVGAIGWIVGQAFGGGGLLGAVFGSMLAIGFLALDNGNMGKGLGDWMQFLFTQSGPKADELTAQRAQEQAVAPANAVLPETGPGIAAAHEAMTAQALAQARAVAPKGVEVAGSEANAYYARSDAARMAGRV